MVSGLYLGAKNKKVKEIQQMLIDMGYDLGKPGADGIYGKITEEAVRNFQRDFHIKPHGGVDSSTLEYIKVAWVQTMLDYLGFDCGKTDGRYGRKTRAGIQAFELSHGMIPRGQITDQLIKKIKDEVKKRRELLTSTIRKTSEAPADVTRVWYVPGKEQAYAPLQKPEQQRTKEQRTKARRKHPIKKRQERSGGFAFTVSQDTVEFFAPIDRNKGKLVIDTVLEAANFTGVPPEILLSLVVSEHIDLTSDTDNQLWWLRNRDINFWKPGPAGEFGPTQMTLRAIKQIEDDLPSDVREGPKDWRYYMYASALYIRYICKVNGIDLSTLSQNDVKRIFYHWNAGPFAKGKTNRFAEKAFEIYRRIIDKNLLKSVSEYKRKPGRKTGV